MQLFSSDEALANTEHWKLVLAVLWHRNFAPSFTPHLKHCVQFRVLQYKKDIKLLLDIRECFINLDI